MAERLGRYRMMDGSWAPFVKDLLFDLKDLFPEINSIESGEIRRTGIKGVTVDELRGEKFNNFIDSRGGA